MEGWPSPVRLQSRKLLTGSHLRGFKSSTFRHRSYRVIVAEHVVAALLEDDDFDPKSEVDTLLPYGEWHPVHGIDNKFLRTFFKEYGLKLLRTYRSRRDGSLNGLVQDVAGLVDPDRDTYEIEALFKKYLHKIDPQDQILVHFFQGDRHKEAGKFYFMLERRDTREKWQAEWERKRREEESRHRSSLWP